METDPRAISFFSNPSRAVLYPVVAKVPAPSSWHVILWRKYTSFDHFQYDPGPAPFRPGRRSSDTTRVAYTITFAQLAHAHGYEVIAMPAINFMQAMFRGQNKYTSFVNYGFAKLVAPYVAFYHIQAQVLQQNIDGPPPSFTSFVRDIAAHVHDTNPNAIIAVGISTNTLMVSGYWLNVVGSAGATVSDALLRLSP